MNRTYIGEAGFFAFLRSSDIALTSGLIGPAEHRLRLSTLRDLVDPDTDRFIEWGWPRGEREPEFTSSDRESHHEFSLESVDADGTPISHSAFLGDPRDSSLVLRLLTSVSPTLGDKWVFHQGDADWFPSVPHGHLHQNRPIKLDVYRGWTFDTSNNNKQGKREDREFIVNLWNDLRFRALATNAISHFCGIHPGFDWLGYRGIANPFVLPKFRKP